MKILRRLYVSLSWRLGCFQRWCRKLVAKDTQWARVIMNRECESFVRSLDPARLTVLEISGDRWRNFGFKSYRSIQFPDYDICSAPLAQNAYDLIIAEQVLEHVVRPYRAVQNVYQMLKMGGSFMVNTPFMIRIHEVPTDYSRWTAAGLKQLLVEGEFPEDQIQAKAWGNQACVRANFEGWAGWIPWLDSLENESQFPVIVWAYARK